MSEVQGVWRAAEENVLFVAPLYPPDLGATKSLLPVKICTLIPISPGSPSRLSAWLQRRSPWRVDELIALPNPALLCYSQGLDVREWDAWVSLG
jgi:hypothetical protein